MPAPWNVLVTTYGGTRGFLLPTSVNFEHNTLVEHSFCFKHMTKTTLKLFTHILLDDKLCDVVGLAMCPKQK